MSRLAKNHIVVPAGVTTEQTDSTIAFKGVKGLDSLNIHDAIVLNISDNKIQVSIKDGRNDFLPMLGTTVRNIENILHGVTKGFERKLSLVGVGYRAKSAGKDLELSLGFSHPIIYKVPEGIEVSVDKNTTVIVSGVNKQKVGQVAANIRSYRPPEPYKGKGVRYEDENVKRKETKKKQ